VVRVCNHCGGAGAYIALATKKTKPRSGRGVYFKITAVPCRYCRGRGKLGR
jgi:hypothetical protein